MEGGGRRSGDEGGRREGKGGKLRGKRGVLPLHFFPLIRSPSSLLPPPFSLSPFSSLLPPPLSSPRSLCLPPPSSLHFPVCSFLLPHPLIPPSSILPLHS